VGSVHLWQNAVRPVKKHRSGGAGAEGDDPGEAQSLRQGSLRYNEKMLEPLTGESAFFSRFKGTIDQRGSASSGRLTGPIGL
jgi:hypothetical protein